MYHRSLLLLKSGVFRHEREYASKIDLVVLASVKNLVHFGLKCLELSEMTDFLLILGFLVLMDEFADVEKTLEITEGVVCDEL
jgi:hypothetical protein